MIDVIRKLLFLQAERKLNFSLEWRSIHDLIWLWAEKRLKNVNQRINDFEVDLWLMMVENARRIEIMKFCFWSSLGVDAVTFSFINAVACQKISHKLNENIFDVDFDSSDV